VRTLCIHVFDEVDDAPNQRARETCSTTPQDDDDVVADEAVALDEADAARVNSPNARVNSRTARAPRIAVVAIVAVAVRSNRLRVAH